MIEEIKLFFIKNILPIIEEYKNTNQEFKKLGDEIGQMIQKQSNYLEDLSKGFQTIFASVQLTSEATQVMERETKEIRELSNNSIDSLDGVIHTIEQLTGEVQHLTGVLWNIKEHSSQLKNAIAEIVKISEMTIVASRNAQIKAYHAGEMGRGFEVIARQMVDLVGQTETATLEIPKITERIENDVVNMTTLVDEMQKFLEKFEMVGEYLNDAFKHILSIVPNLERDTTEAARLISEQDKIKTILLSSNWELNNWLADTFELSEKAASALIFLKGFSHEVISKAERAKMWEDTSRHNLYYFLIRFFNILSFTVESHQKWAKKVPKPEGVFDFEKFSNTLSDSKATSQDIKQSIVRQSADLKKSEGILEASLNTLARETSEEASIFHALGEAETVLNDLKDLPYKVLFFEKELNAIVERSRILSLYAAIESARAGGFSQPLTMVADEIKTLSSQAKNAVNNIAEWREALILDFESAIRVIQESKKFAQEEGQRLDESSKKIRETLKKIKELCSLIDETNTSIDRQLTTFMQLEGQLKNVGGTYEDILQEFDHYLSAGMALPKILEKISNYKDEYLTLLANLIREKEPPMQLVIRESADPIILDPAFKTDVVSDRIGQQIHIGLFNFDDEGNIVPGVASDFTISEDGMLWVFYLRKDIKFHNGQPLTAADVLYSIERVKTGPNVGFVEYVEEMKIIDDFTIQFKLKYPYLPFLANLACGTCQILPRLAYDSNHPIGAGPYRFVRWEKNREIVLRANENFYEGRPAIDELIFRNVPDEHEAVEKFQQGEISFMEILHAQIDESKIALHFSPGLSTQYLAINLSKDTPFRIKEVRQAMNYIVDREYYVKELLKNRGIPARGIFPPGISAYNSDLRGYQYDPEKAKYLMEKAGFTRGLSESYELDTRDSQSAVERAEYIRERLAHIGIKTKINKMLWKDLLNKTYSGESFLSMRGWVSDNGDPDNFMYPLFHSRSCGEAGNITFYRSEETDKMIEAARQIRNFERRMDYYRRLEEKLVEDAPWVFLNHGVNYYIIQPDIFNLKIDPFGIVRVKYIYKKRWNRY